MESPLIRKLSRFVALSAAEIRTLSELTHKVAEVEAHTVLVGEGQKPTTVRVLLEGFAFRYKDLPDGGRQIVAYILPGDVCNPHIFILKRMDHSIATLARCKFAELSADDVLKVTDLHPAIARAVVVVFGRRGDLTGVDHEYRSTQGDWTGCASALRDSSPAECSRARDGRSI